MTLKLTPAKQGSTHPFISLWYSGSRRTVPGFIFSTEQRRGNPQCFHLPLDLQQFLFFRA